MGHHKLKGLLMESLRICEHRKLTSSFTNRCLTLASLKDGHQNTVLDGGRRQWEHKQLKHHNNHNKIHPFFHSSRVPPKALHISLTCRCNDSVLRYPSFPSRLTTTTSHSTHHPRTFIIIMMAFRQIKVHKSFFPTLSCYCCLHIRCSHWAIILAFWNTLYSVEICVECFSPFVFLIE